MVRRFIDVLVALVALTVLWPVMALIAIAIKLDSPGPILYNRAVMGRHGRPFWLLGFRTMRAEGGPVEPERRLTRVGRVVRDLSLDHLPQLINLLKGDLSIMGPRAMERELVNMSDPVWQRYFSVAPGVFNYAVLLLGREWSASRQMHPELNQELELEYLSKRSGAFDLALVGRCLWGLVASRGNVKARGEPDSDVARRLE